VQNIDLSPAQKLAGAIHQMHNKLNKWGVV